ncbi:hypothetical protein SNE40_009165 [Patella caerulea]|uniref:Secreted protein n=1 Tax=Patella caerulea TaxID=87958 RepID=A0AAN8JND7_PATCE
MGSTCRCYLFFLLVSCGWLITASWKPGCIGHFRYNPKDGYTCKYAECRKSGPTKRKFHVVCEKRNQQPYECVYEGNPHDCHYYNSHQIQFYKGLSVAAGKDQPTACSQYQLVFERCKDIKMTRTINKRNKADPFCTVKSDFIFYVV